jgi:ABC-2 type transport system permease protein
MAGMLAMTAGQTRQALAEEAKAFAGTPAWLSPLGWGQQMRPFGGDNWWPLALSAIAAAFLLGAASALATLRDVGSGILAERRGHAAATPGLLSPFGLIWRL